MGGIKALGDLVASFLDYTRFAVNYMEFQDSLVRHVDKCNIEAYIDLHLWGRLNDFPDNYWLVFQDGKCIDQINYSSAFDTSNYSKECTFIRHTNQKNYLESYPERPEILNLDENTEKSAEELVVAQYFRVMFPPQHIRAPQWMDALFFPDSKTRMTIDSFGNISVDLDDEYPQYNQLDYHKVIQVPKSVLERLQQYGQLDMQRQAVYRTLVK